MPVCAQFLKGGDVAHYCERRETARGCLIEKNASRPSYFFIIGAERICFNLNGYQPLVFTEPTRPLFFFGIKGCTIEPSNSTAMSNTNAISTPAR